VKGALYERLGTLPRVEILSLDEGGCVETLDCHRRAACLPRPDRGAEFRPLLDRLRRGFRENAVQEIGSVSTVSAYINQAINPKKHLDAVQAICDETGGAGLVTTHSGTCLGVLYDVTRPGHRENLARAARALRAYGRVDVYATVA
jgi:uncharacterized protein involved in propanediol utilization